MLYLSEGPRPEHTASKQRFENHPVLTRPYGPHKFENHPVLTRPHGPRLDTDRTPRPLSRRDTLTAQQARRSAVCMYL